MLLKYVVTLWGRFVSVLYFKMASKIEGYFYLFIFFIHLYSYANLVYTQCKWDSTHAHVMHLLFNDNQMHIIWDIIISLLKSLMSLTCPMLRYSIFQSHGLTKLTIIPFTTQVKGA